MREVLEVVIVVGLILFAFIPVYAEIKNCKAR